MRPSQQRPRVGKEAPKAPVRHNWSSLELLKLGILWELRPLVYMWKILLECDNTSHFSLYSFILKIFPGCLIGVYKWTFLSHFQKPSYLPIQSTSSTTLQRPELRKNIPKNWGEGETLPFWLHTDMWFESCCSPKRSTEYTDVQDLFSRAKVTAPKEK